MKLLDGFKERTYNIGFVHKEISDIFSGGLKEGDIIWMRHRYRDRFFADPFLMKEDDKNLYILCEEFLFWRRVGQIVLLTVDRHNYSLKERKLFIKEIYHLSFPYCTLNGEWIVPEACWSGKAFAYQIDVKTMKIKRKIQIADDGLVDNVFYRDNDKSVWLYAGTTKCVNDGVLAYKLGGQGRFFQTGTEPVECGLACSRSAGAFFEYNGKLYRPVQDCRERYGKQVKIMEMLSIGESGYRGKECCTLNSFENPLYNETMHTFNVYKDIILVDGSRDVLNLPRHFCYKVYMRVSAKRRNPKSSTQGIQRRTLEKISGGRSTAGKFLWTYEESSYGEDCRGKET